MAEVPDREAWGINDPHQLESQEGGANYLVGINEYSIPDREVEFILNRYGGTMTIVRISPDEAEEMGLRLVAVARIVRARAEQDEGSEHA